MKVVYTDSGVVYSKDGKTLSFNGEQDDGEVFVDDTLLGYYERDEDDMVTITTQTGKVLAVIGCDEDAYEAYAATVLV
jgi:hypothetical protein